MDDAEIVVGRVMRAHGLRGQLVIQPASPGSDVLLDVSAVTATLAGKRERLVVSDSRVQGKLLLLSFKGYPDRTAAERLIGAELWLKTSELPPPDPDEFYVSDLIGFAIESPSGDRLGSVVDIESAGDLVWLGVQTPTGRRLVPFTEPLVRVDPAKKRVVVDAPPGLLDDSSD